MPSEKRIIDSVEREADEAVRQCCRKTGGGLCTSRKCPNCRTGGDNRWRSVNAAGAGATRHVPTKLATENEVPEYAPATTRSPMLADADNHVWLRPVPLTPEAGFVIWDVISRTDGVVDRVRIPESRTIAGFGPGGFIYLVAHDGGVATLEKVKLR